MDADVALADFVQWLAVEKGRSPATLEAYQRDINEFLKWWGDADVATVERGTLDRYIVELRRRRAPSSVARALSSLRGFFGFLVDERLLVADPSSHVRPARRGRTLPKPLDELLINHLIDSVNDADPVSLRDRALLEFLYGTGARVSELTSLELPDLDFDEGLIRVTGKGSKQRLVPMGETLRTALRAYLSPGGRREFRGARSHAHVFVNIRGGALSRQGVDLIIHQRALAVGIDRTTISAHVFRHSCATHMLNRGADIRVVQELLGHASITTTQVYTAVSMTTLHQAYDAAHPRAHG